MRRRMRRTFQHYKEYGFQDFKPKFQKTLDEREENIFENALEKLWRDR